MIWLQKKNAAEGHRPCPYCGALVKKGKIYCDNPNCNIHLRSAREPAEEPEPAEDTSKVPKFWKINFKIDEKTKSAKPVVENYLNESGRYAHVTSR